MSDIILEIIRAIVVSVIFIYLWIVGGKEEIRRQDGWLFILTGFGLILFGMLIDITDNFSILNKYIVIGDTAYQAFLEKVVGYLVGFILLAVGFWKWMPTVVRLRETEKKLKESHDELELRVKERTAELEIEITERKQAEKALRESEERHRLFFENSPIGIIHYDNQGIITDVNEAMITTFGSSLEKLIGIDIDDIPDKMYANEVYKSLNGELGYYEGEYKSYTSGTVASIKANWVPIIRDGEVIAGVGIVEDVTAKKQAEEALRKSEEKYRNIFENLQDVYLKITLDGTIEDVSPSAEYFSGYSAAELIGKKVDIMCQNPKDREGLLNEIRKKGKVWGYELLFKKKNGESFDVSVNADIYYSEDGVPIGMTGTIRDITERKKLEGQLQQVQKMESIGTLAGGIAHDFNNILGIIVGNTELAMDDVPEWNPARHNLEEIRTASMGARDVVKQILAFSRQSPQEMKPVRISPIIKESLKLLRSSIPTTIEIHQNISSESDTVRADPTKINQLLINLCTNAAQAMGEKGGVLEVSLKNIEMDEGSAIHYHDLSSGKYVRLTVSDTGHGIEPKILERIFDPYFTTKKVGEGSGMGLSVVHGIVKSHGGGISATSEPGKGTIFHVLFPCIEDEPEPEVEIAVEIPKGKERILFVDDEKAMVDAIQPMIERLGYKVTARTSSIEGLEAFRANPGRFDLVITDFTMPNMTGMELAKELLKLRSDMPIILCTGYSEHINEDKAKGSGIRAFLMKPVVLGEIANTIRKVLDQEKE